MCEKSFDLWFDDPVIERGSTEKKEDDEGVIDSSRKLRAESSGRLALSALLMKGELG